MGGDGGGGMIIGGEGGDGGIGGDGGLRVERNKKRNHAVIYIY